MKQEGGLLSAEDLAEYRSPVTRPERRRFGDLEVFTCGAWCQGPVLLQTLALLEGTDLAGLGHNSADYVHRLTEALKLAFADREAYYGDPAMVEVPLATLISQEYAAERRKLIRPDRAWPEMPPAGEIGRSDRAASRRPRAIRTPSPTPPMSASPTATAICSRRPRATAPTARRWCRGPGSFRRTAARNRAPTRAIRPASPPANGRG